MEEGQFELGTGSRVADNGVIAGEKWIAFMTVYQEVRNNPNFKCIMINSGKMNPQGTYFIADWSHTGSYPDGTMKIDIASGNTEDIKVNFRIGQILRDGSMTGRIEGIIKTPDEAYVWPAGKEPMTLFDYFEQTKPEFAEFMDDYKSVNKKKQVRPVLLARDGLF